MSEKEKFIAAIDIGTTKIVTLVGRKDPAGKLEVLALSKAPSKGVKRGVVQNIEETVNAIKSTVEEVQGTSGVPFAEVFVGIAGQHIKSIRNRGYINRDSDEDEITKDMTESYIFKRLQITSGTKIIPMATVELASGEDRITESSTGDGPVDAACRAIERATGIQGLLLDYGIKSVTQGKDAVGEVTVRVKIDNKPFVGRSVSTDVVIASAKAYLDAVNRALFMRSKKKNATKKKTAAKRSAKKSAARRSTRKTAAKKR